MTLFRPVHGLMLVAFFVAVFVVGDFALDGGFTHSGFERVAPAPDGTVTIPIGGIEAGKVEFFRFLNAGNQEVKFFVGRDSEGAIQVAFDANEICFKTKRGYEGEGDWVTCRKCAKSFRLNEINAGGGGCKPVPLVHRLEGDRLILTEMEILRGWRFFR